MPVARAILALALAGALALAHPIASPDQAVLVLQPAVEGAMPDPASELPEVEVVVASGERFKGFLRDRTSDTLVLVIEGITTEIRLASVVRVVELGTITEQYQRARSAIDDRDSAQILLLANWLIVRHRYPDALREIDHVLALEPNLPGALDVRRLVLAHMALGPSRPAEARPREERDRPDDLPLLTPDQINILKVYEIDLGSPPKLLIERGTIDRLVDAFAGHELIPATREQREALYRKRPEQILELMFRLRARDLYPEVRVLGHPRAVERFRDEVQRAWLVNTCATDRCHGGTEAGRLRLHTRRINSEASVYTNLLILDRFRLDDGRPLIDYEQPAESPLLQMGLPREDARTPHPEIEGRDAWRPVFRSREDRPFVHGVEWILSMYRPRPEYPIVYPPPPESGDPGAGTNPGAEDEERAGGEGSPKGR